MEFSELLKRRRMVRAYQPELVPRETLERIVRTIRRAPSASFSQGQRFVVVTDQPRKQAIAEAVGEEFYLERGFAPWISGAVALVVVCTREEDYRERYRQPDKRDAARDTTGWPAPYWHVDAGAAAMLVQLAAINEGLDAGVFGVPVERAQPVRELLKLPDDIAIVEVVALAWPAKDTVSDQVSSRATRPPSPLTSSFAGSAGSKPERLRVRPMRLLGARGRNEIARPVNALHSGAAGSLPRIFGH